jgi:hypothetical protein
MGDSMEILERVWVSFWYVDCIIISSVSFMHGGLCAEITILALFVVMVEFGNNIVIVIGLHE